MGFPQIWGTFWEFLITRTIIYWGLYWGPPFQGNYPVLSFPQVAREEGSRITSSRRYPTATSPRRGIHTPIYEPFYKACKYMEDAKAQGLVVGFALCCPAAVPQSFQNLPLEEKVARAQRQDSQVLCKEWAHLRSPALPTISVLTYPPQLSILKDRTGSLGGDTLDMALSANHGNVSSQT